MKPNRIDPRVLAQRAIEFSRCAEDRLPTEKERRWAQALLDQLFKASVRLRKGHLGDGDYLRHFIPALLRLQAIANGQRPPSIRVELR